MATATAGSRARSETDPSPSPELTPSPTPSPTPTAEAEDVGGAGGGAVVIIVKEKEVGEGKGSRAHSAAAEEKPAEDVEKVCRICHLSPDHSIDEGSEVIQIGCGCKNELGAAHRHCAETWFRLKGNRCCEICGANAKNITGVEAVILMEEWHSNRAPPSSAGHMDHMSSSEAVGCWRGQPLCNFLMACLVIAFILPWFFRVNMF